MNSSLIGKLTSGKENNSSGTSWLEKHWDTAACLLGIFVVALIIRSYFAYEAATRFGLPYLLGGGADSYYNARIINYIAENHQHLFTDPMRTYPLQGNVNTRPPLYQWSVVLVGYLILPFVGNLDKAISISFIFSSAFWSALTVFPLYLIGKKTFGKKAGIAGALILTLSAAHLGRGVLTNTNHDAFSMFWIVTGFFFFMRSLEEIRAERKWVQDWTKVEKIKKGLTEFFANNKRALLYSAMTGMVFGALALTWKGYSYAVVIILVYFLVQLVIDKFRGRDSLGITVAIFVMFTIAFFVALPWYGKYRYGMLEQFTTLISWPLGRYFQIPLVIFLGTFSIGVYFSMTRDLPWVLTFSILAIAGVVFFTLGPDVITNAASQYFIQNKLYSTIAEAQAPPFSRLVLSTGVATFFISFVAIPLAGWHLKKTWRRSFLFVLVWITFAIYMATTATRFIFNASPAFALTSGWIIALIFDKAEFAEFGRSFKSHRGNVIRGIREGVKIKHVLVTLFVVFLILTPNAMYAIDAGTPFQEKEKYNEQIHRALPEQLRPDDYEPEQGNLHYLGAFGYSMDRPDQYWPTAWEWFSKQDNELPPEERPAFVSWWDYGFEAIDRGRHPTVADNFQHGYRFTGNFLMAQSESEMMALLVGRQLQLPYNEEGDFEGKVEDILIDHIGEKKTEKLEDVYENPASYKSEVLSNPDKYHPRAKDIDNRNVRWAMIMGTLSNEKLETLTSLYRDISYKSGYERLENRMGYFAVDSRLFPASGRNTGIFHAPAYLSGHRVKQFGRTRAPVDFYSFEFIDSQGRTYDDPDNVPPNAQIVNQRINHKSMFFNSALYRIFAGYGKHEVGDNEQGIPGLSRQQGMGRRNRLEPMPSWNLTHFKDVHRTAYFNPNPSDDVQNHTDAWEAMPYEEAVEYRDDENVTVDLSGRSYLSQGVIFAKYFDGAVLKGQVKTDEGQPIPNTKIAVIDTTDNRNTVHDVTKTDEQGRYEAILPEGNMTVLVSNGKGGRELIKKEEILLANKQFEITEEQAMRKQVDRDGDGKWDYKLKEDFVVSPGTVSGDVFLDTNGNGEYDQDNETLISDEGKMNLRNRQSDIDYTAEIENGTYEFSEVVPGNYSLNTSIPGGAKSQTITVQPDQDVSKDIPVTVGQVAGNVTFGKGVDTGSVTLSVQGAEKTTELSVEEGEEYGFSDLPFGEYTLYIEDEGYTLEFGPSEVLIKDSGKVTRELEVVKGYRLEGRVTKDDEPLGNQRLTILGKNYDRVIQTEDDGHFSIKVPRADYQIYGVNRGEDGVYVNLDRVLVESDTEYRGEFERGYKLTGQTVFEDEVLDRSQLYVKSRSGPEYYITTNPDGRFKTYLPEGDYTIYGWKEFGFRQRERDDRYFWADIRLDRNKEVMLGSSVGYKVQGQVFRNLWPSGQDGEGIFTNIQVSCEGKTLTTATTIDGNYSIYLPEGDCTFTIEKEGYHEKTLTLDPSNVEEKDIYLDAKNISVEGDVEFDRESSAEPTIEFKPIGNGAVGEEVTIEDGSYSVDLQPGEYEIASDHLLSEGDAKYEISDSLSIEPGDADISKDLLARYKVKVEGDIDVIDNDVSSSAEIYFQGPEDKIVSTDGSYVTYLLPGNYSVRAVHPKGHLAVQKKIVVEEAMSMDILLEDTYSVDAQLEGLRRQGIPVHFKNKDTGFVIETLSGLDGELNLNVTAGDYDITVDHVIEQEIKGVEREVRYHLSQEESTPISATLSLEKEILNSSLSGKVTLAGTPISELDLQIMSEDSDFDLQTDENGEYHLDELIHGRYTIYASYQSKGNTYAVFESFKMPAEDKELDISLEKAVIFSGKAKLNGEGVETELDLIRGTASKQFSTAADGTFKIRLPKGRYSISTQLTREMEYGSTDFEYSDTFDLQYDEHRQIKLNKVKEYEIEIDELKSITASQGEQLEFTAQITNAGNTIDEYEFSAPDSKWDVSFEPESVTIEPNEKKQVKIEVQVGENAKVGDSVTINVDSINSDEKVERKLPIEIRQIFGVELSSDAQEMNYGEGEFTYSVNLENKGNGIDSYSVQVTNVNTLNSNGWNVTVPNQMVDVGAQEEKSIEVTLQATSSNPKRSPKVQLMVVSRGDNTVKDSGEYISSLPKITGDADKVEFSEEKFALEEEPFTLSTWQWAGIVILVAIVALYVMKKKRWL